MDEGVPALEVGFAIDTGGSFTELERLREMLNSSEMNALKAASEVERAFGNIKLGKATAEVSSFGSAATRELQNVRRETAQAEKSGEAMVRQLERQVETFGKTTTEIRNMRAELRAVAAEDKGMTELAGRIRTLNAEMNRLESSAGGAAGSSNATRAAMQGLSFQAQDAFTQISMGANVLNVLAIQGGQAAGQMANMGGKLGAVASFLVGPWGLAITGGLLLLGSLTKGLFDNEEASKAAAEGMKHFQDRQSDIGNFIDATTGKLVEQNKTLVLNAILTRQAQIAQNDKIASEGRQKALATATAASNFFSPARQGTNIFAGAKPTFAVEGMGDPQVRKAISDAGGDIDKLTTSIVRLSQTTRPDLKPLALSISSQSGAAVIAQRENERLGKELRALNGDTSALANGTSALIDKQVALATATTPLARARAQLALVQQSGAAADKAGGAALAKYQSDLTAASLAVNKAEAAEKAASAARRESTKASSAAASAAKAEATHAADLAREARAVEAQTANLLELANAYGSVASDALIAEARVKAESNAIKARGDVEAFVSRQVGLVIAQRAADAARSTAAMRDQANVQEAVNEMVAAGNIPAAQAAQLVRDRMADLPLLAAIEAAEKINNLAGAKAVTEQLEKQRATRERLTAAEAAARNATEMATGADQLEVLQKEYDLIGATNAERVHALALLKATQEANQKIGQTPEQAAAWIAQQVAIADQTERNAAAARDYDEALGFAADKWDLIARNVQDGARGMADAFGEVGRAIGDMSSIYADYRADTERGLLAHTQAIREAGKDEAAIARENAKFALASSAKQIGMYGDMVAAAKGFFKEKSVGYQAAMAAEKVFRAFQFAMSVRQMVQDASETISSVANSAARSTANAAEGVSAQAKLPFPFNLAAMAATAAALVAAGIAVIGGGGTGAAAAVKTSEDYQKAQGTGSVLGDASAKSSSIGNSLDLMMKNSNKDLEYSSQMVRALQAIQSGIGNIASAVGRQMAVGGGLDASKLALGTNTSGGILGLFGKSVTTELNDSGLTFGSTTVGAAIADGITANLYQEVLKTTKKSGFLGIGGSTKTTTQTVSTAADAGLTDEVSKLLASMRTAIVGAAGTIGVDGAAAMLDAFQINIGRISLKGLSASEIETELAAVFSRVGDDMAGAIGGGLSAYQHAGEGMLETLMRLAKEYTTIDVSLRSIGMTFGSVGLASVGARDALVGLFGGLDEFTSATDFFRENFLSEAEQMAPVIASVTAEMDRLGLSGVTTKDQFKQVVLGLDLSTDAGQQMYAALMAVAPAFAKTADYTASLTGALGDVAKTAEQLAEIAKQRRSLEIALMDATGDAAGALAAKRADELAGMDESLRALQSQVYAAQDAAQAARDLAAADAEAARAATALASQRRGLEIELMEAIGDAAGAAAARRQDELAALDASLRPIKEQIYAAQDAAAAAAALAQAQDAATAAQAEAADAARQIAEQRRGMEIALMEALGDAVGATAAKRADEIAALDASLRPLQEQINAAQDAAAAQSALAAAQTEAAQTAAALAQTRRGLEIQLMEAEGDAAGALAAKRADEIGALDASLRALQAQVYAAQDAAAANAALASAQASAAATAMQAAQEQAAAAAQIAQQRSTLEIALLRAQGNEAAAVAQERANQLSVTDVSLRGLQEQVWAAQDAKTAAEAAAQAQAEYARQQQEAAQDAERQAQDLEQQRRTRVGLEADLLEAMGNASGALALRRQEELAALDESLRPLKQALYAQQDMAARISAARDTLTESYKRESDALQGTIDKFASFGDSLRTFRGTLGGAGDATVDAYRAAQARFVDTSALAARGDETAIGNLEKVSQDFLAASKDRAGSLVEYQRDVARVASSVDRAIGASDEAADYAKLQLDALKSSVSGLIEVNQSVVSVHDAILSLQAAMTGAPDPAAAAELPATAYTPAASQSVAVDTEALERRIDELSARLSVQNTAIAENTGKMTRFMERWDGGGLLVRADQDDPLHVSVEP